MEKSLKLHFQPIFSNQQLPRRINLIDQKKTGWKEPKTTFSAYIFKSKICSERQFDGSEKNRLEKSLKLHFQPIFLNQKFARKTNLIDLKKAGWKKSKTAFSAYFFKSKIFSENHFDRPEKSRLEKSLKLHFQPIFVNQKFTRKINLIDLKKPVGKEPKTAFSAYVLKSKTCSENQFDRSEKSRLEKA